MSEMLKHNHLEHELSPYLIQHATNPVDWYPWGKDALEKARKENKPILLSIGYAACHWCHVMAHESFEDPETAELMNNHFVNIKVDREERPDLDKIYQTTHYLLTQRDGGWPLTVFLMPDDLTPFYSGTFFPLRSRYQLPAFKEVLLVIIDMYQNHLDELKLQNLELNKILRHQQVTKEPITLDPQPLLTATEILQWNYDSTNGGFNGAPKFFQATKLEFLMLEQSSIVSHSLKQIASGGIVDHLAGGFFRYAVDAEWRIPHFEKMLYDNAQLIDLYARAAKIYEEPSFAEVARMTANWVINVMQSEEGGYYASMDADSDGEEGKYYVWRKNEIKELLTSDEYAVIKLHFGLNQAANFDHHWHFYIALPLEVVSEELKIPLKNAQKLLASAKQKLLKARNNRNEPLIDTEILTAWNALMIKGMLSAGYLLNEPKFIESAERAIQFIQNKVWKNKRLNACYKNGKAYISAYLDDYAFMLDALLTASELFPNSKYQQFANDIADTLLTYFYDEEHGGFYFTPKDHEKLLYRPKTFVDEATPSGNGIAAAGLLKLARKQKEPKDFKAVEKTLKCAWPSFSQYPSEHCSLMIVLKEYLNHLAR